ncbi:type IV pilus modification protein PilV [Pseudoalteromonas sp. SCSIO 43201]|uniref:Type IV pilus assembly protein PilV n=1 Tax=Pseudoalteromonas peptidolytica F12-50-A1 TaxID=1315280 RepID=A0A8I0MUQ6_9GAMM|nr:MULTISPECIES: type IV pilus modification protein PilV [Pseudoalteromonas]MBE0345732.1 type IV pilus assembly protein PilV [Pseudoalteromonas peptidolytica F12-50-A1]MDW7547829.1 type IV pilus modification protein PilV [Pseudoalteromonas peptidolytica]NLR14349.1 type IV pilus modification protein PilV [Pseudoalteromonas peptidolytica]USD27570.1 type IV pilus modification protein PilV [Pseudoalteromonas sp. SCSIO 43201]GEK07906.1 type IV pilus modification protein PilV [Pseudoalteromonas pept
MRIKYRQQGFTLLEVLIAFMILSFGLLGAVALQAKAKQASFDSMQRAAAVELASDIMHRIRSNDATNIATLYNVDFNSTEAVQDTTACYNNFCNAAAIAQTDIANWRRAIRARENTGALDNAVVCINPTTGADASGINVEVIVTWRGRQAMTALENNPAGDCGVADDRRRAVVMQTFVLIRSEP